MRTFGFSVLAAAAISVTAVSAPADAATPWFAPQVTTTINNGMGPGPAPRGTATADFNRDGKADLVTIGNFTTGNILFLPGNGDGTFATSTEIAGTSQTQGLDAGDVNGDGNPDVVAMTTSRVTIEYGDGHGAFTAGPSYPLTLGGQVEPLLVDLNGDGRLDIVAPSFTSIQSLINSGNGTFTAGPTTQVSGASIISAISVAKLNADAKPDLFVVDGSSGSIFALKGTGTGAFTTTGTLYASGFVPEDIAAIDLNGDGYDDVASIGSFSFTLATALTNGNGTFTGITGNVQYAGPGPTSISVADFDRDGRKDLVISSLATPAPALTVLAGNGTVAMRKVGDFPVGIAPQNPVIADYNGDGRADIAVVGPGAVSYLANTTP